jgi:penicillin G amidase
VNGLLRWLLAITGVVVAITITTFVYLVKAPLPDYPQTVEVTGLSAPVSIRFDPTARPYVSASTFVDAVYAQGWLHAHERLWQMELLRRAGGGRLAEMLGGSLLDTDLEVTRAGVPALAKRLADNASAETRALVDAYVSGINQAMTEVTLPLELRLLDHEPQPWRADDVFAIGALMAFQSGRNMRSELLRLALLERLSPEQALLFGGGTIGKASAAASTASTRLLAMEAALGPQQPYYVAPLLGSNGWVVAPSRSESGHALFAFDSHDAWSMPNLFYEVHLFFARGQQVRGWSVPGLPGVVNGFNEFMAWGFTNIGDSQDLFIETRDPNDPLRFKGRAGWYQAQQTLQEIPVKDAPAHQLQLIVTENGPLISEDPPLSLRWSASEGGELGLDGLFLLNRATSLDAFMAALDQFPAPSANVTYADVNGEIVFRTVGLLPIRGRGEGLVPLPADAPDSGWRGLQPLNELPTKIGSVTGYLAAANARVPGPFLVSADNAPGYRSARLEELLSGNQAISFDDMRRWQLDWYNKQAQWLLPPLLENLAHCSNEGTAAVVDELLQWSQAPVNSQQSSMPLLFNTWYIELAHGLFEPVIGAQLTRSLLADNYLLNHALDTLIRERRPGVWWRG